MTKNGEIGALAVVRDTKTALDAMGQMSPVHRAHALRLGVELQAMLEGQIDWVAKDKGTRQDIVKTASPAMCCAAVLVCMQNGMSVGAGHVFMLGGKLYVGETGYLAAAQFDRAVGGEATFRGFSKPRAMSDDERKMCGLADKERYICCVAVEAKHAGYDEPALGFGWWDCNKDQDSTMTVPFKKAHTRARRHALKQLYGLGTNPDDTPSLQEDGNDPTVVVEVQPRADQILPRPRLAPVPVSGEAKEAPTVKEVLTEMDEETAADEPVLASKQVSAFEDLPGGERVVAYKTFLRLAWRADQQAVKSACSEMGVEPAKAQSLPDVELSELVERVAEVIGDEEAESALVRATQEAMKED